MNPEIRPLEYNTKLVVCDSTISSVLRVILEDFPSVKETIKCSINNCQLNNKPPYSLVYLTYQTTNGKITNLQQMLDDRQLNKKILYGHFDSGIYCDGVKEIISNISEMHLFFDVLLNGFVKVILFHMFNIYIKIF